MCDECSHQEALDLANEMLDDPRYEFADRSIEGIRDWVAKNKHVTDRQRSALENIRNSVTDKDDL